MINSLNQLNKQGTRARTERDYSSHRIKTNRDHFSCSTGTNRDLSNPRYWTYPKVTVAKGDKAYRAHCGRPPIRVCKIGDYVSNQNVINLKTTIVLLRLRSIAKVEYKLISGPLLGWPDQLLKP
jgi:hypothetical protein